MCVVGSASRCCISMRRRAGRRFAFPSLPVSPSQFPCLCRSVKVMRYPQQTNLQSRCHLRSRSSQIVEGMREYDFDSHVRLAVHRDAVFSRRLGRCLSFSFSVTLSLSFGESGALLSATAPPISLAFAFAFFSTIWSGLIPVLGSKLYEGFIVHREPLSPLIASRGLVRVSLPNMRIMPRLRTSSRVIQRSGVG